MENGVGVLGSNVIMFKKARTGEIPSSRPANDDTAQSEGIPAPIKTVTLRKKLDKSGVEVKIKVPVSEYIGVAVSTHITEDGVLSSAIELVHDDADLNYQVYEETGNFNVVAEWQNWGRQLRLPLFIRAGDGQLMPYSQQVDGIMLGQNTARRKTLNEATRRPHFLNRRRPGISSIR